MEGFVLLCVEAPLEVRFARERRRDREGAPLDLATFRTLEARENTTDPKAQQLDATRALADERVVNDGTLEDLERRVEALLERLEAAAARGEERHGR
jgi:dephospho-CoA kinase